MSIENTVTKTITAKTLSVKNPETKNAAVKAEVTSGFETTESVATFASLGLNPAILKAVEEAGYTVPSPIQAQAIPEAMAGHDLMASAQTGTGKTAAFILPALNRIAQPSAVHSKGPRVLVLMERIREAIELCLEMEEDPTGNEFVGVQQVAVEV